MEKFKTKNLILASFIAIAMMFVAMFGFAACGTKGDETVALTEENLVGTYDVVNASFTPTAENTYNTQSATCTKAEYDAITAKVEAEQELTADETYKYYEVFDGFFGKYEVKADHNIHVVGMAQEVQATWAITDGKIVYTEVQQGSYPLSGWTFDVAWDNGKVGITITVPNGTGAAMAGTMVLTLEKVAAA